MELLLLGAVLLGALLLVPLGLPGTWVMIGAAMAFAYLTGTEIGIITLIGIFALAVIGEIIEFTLAARYTRKYGGSRRAGWGAIIGGIIGAIVGVPVPIIGSVIGAFAGAFLGALVAERTRGVATGAATRVATGALLGRAAAVAAKSAIGVVIAVWILLAAWASTSREGGRPTLVSDVHHRATGLILEARRSSRPRRIPAPTLPAPTTREYAQT